MQMTTAKLKFGQDRDKKTIVKNFRLIGLRKTENREA